MKDIKEYSDRFPRWVYEKYPYREYEIKPSRKLFGKQRYGLAGINGLTDVKNDYQSIEEAKPWLNSLNVYAEIFELFLDGKHELIKNMVMWINGENEEDFNGFSDRTIFADLCYMEPSTVALALKQFGKQDHSYQPIKHITKLNMRDPLTNPFYKQGRF